MEKLMRKYCRLANQKEVSVRTVALVVVAPRLRGRAAADHFGHLDLRGLWVQGPAVGTGCPGIDERIKERQDGRVSPWPVVKEPDTALAPLLLTLPLPPVLVSQCLPLPSALRL